jgi:intein/homing endonuclease
MSFIESNLIRKELAPSDMHKMGVGRRYWHVELAKIDPSFDYRETISKYIEKVREHVLAGRGLLFHGEYAGGKCVVPGTLILLNGRLQQIGDIYSGPLAYVPVAGKVWSGEGPRKISHFLDDGARETRRVVLSNGLSLTGTLDHPVLVRGSDGVERFVSLADLRVGDWAVVDLNAPLGEGRLLPVDGADYLTVSEDFAELYAWVLGEGHVTLGDSSEVCITSSERIIRDRVGYLMNLFFGKASIVANKEGSVGTVRISSDSVAALFARLGCAGRSKHKWISKCIIGSPRRVLIKFLRAFFDAEGSISNGHIELTQASTSIINTLQLILLSFGIVSQVKSKVVCATNGSRIRRRYSRLTITGSALIRFRERVGFGLQHKIIALDKASQKMGCRRQHFECVPFVFPVLERIKKAVIRQHGTEKGNQSRKGKGWDGLVGRNSKVYNFVNNSKASGVCSRFGLLTVLSAVENTGLSEVDELRDLVRRDVVYLKVIANIPAGNARVVDLVVPNGHAFWSNGLISHNTSAAVIVAKAAVMHGGTVYFIEVPELSDVKIGTRPFDENTTIWERMMKVDVLILDDIGSEYGTPWSKQLVERAIRLRANAKKPIIGTTNRFGELRTIYGEGVVSVMTSSMLPVLIEGKNWREDEEEQLKKAILGE